MSENTIGIKKNIDMKSLIKHITILLLDVE